MAYGNTKIKADKDRESPQYPDNKKQKQINTQQTSGKAEHHHF